MRRAVSPNYARHHRHLIAAFLLVFSSVVSASFAYALLLLWRGPTRPAEGTLGRPAPLPPDVVALIERSAEQMKKGEVEQAVLGYRRVLTLGPSLEAQLGLAEGEWRAGRGDVATREYERALRLDPQNPTALQRLARAYAGHRETWEQAEARYREYLAQAQGDAEAWLGLARVLAWRGNAAAAAEIYARDDVQPLLTAEDRRNYALALVKAGRDKEAEPILRGLARSNPTDVDVKLSLAGLHASRRDWEQALPLYRAAVERRPDDPVANLAYGQGLLALKDYKAALGPLDKATRAMPSNAEAGLALARALRGAGDLKKADGQFERVLPSLDSDAAVEREYADLLMERKNHPKAVAYYRRALDHGLKDERLLAGLAGALSADGKPKEALPYLEEAYATRRSDRLGFDLAQLYKRLGQNERALRLLAEIEHGPRPR
jgi:tetratricopeptide (TPR) repeat protein